jgi:pyruvate dehydrogenase E2 component (dihydrolipoamide acetyltransferase)
VTVRFTLPDVGEGLDRAEIVELLVAEGDSVGRDQPLLLILTDKAEVELPSPAAGTVLHLAVEPGDMVEVGALLVEIDDGKRAAALTPAASSDSDGPAVPASVAPPTGSGQAVAPVGDRPTDDAAADGAAAVLRPKASPSTRRLAAELGVDLGTVSGSGPGGRVTADDVRAHGSAVPAEMEVITDDAQVAVPGLRAAGAEPAPVTPQGPSPLAGVAYGTQPLRGIRRATAAAMTRSWSEIPHITGMDEIDATALLAARDRLRAAVPEDGPPISALALMIRAVAAALRAHPMANAGVEPGGEAVTVHESCNVGMAAATDHGLVVPIIRDADRLGVLALAAEIARLATAARAGQLTPADLRGGTATVTNYGSLGDSHYATPLIRPGEATIVGFGSIRRRPWVVGDEIEVRPVLPVVVSADHRIIDGDLLNAFANRIKADLTDPLRMLL